MIILTISPHSYQINQIKSFQKEEILLLINNQWPSNNERLNRFHVPIESRIQEFRSSFFTLLNDISYPFSLLFLLLFRHLLSLINLNEIQQKEEYLSFYHLFHSPTNSNTDSNQEKNHSQENSEVLSEINQRKKLKTMSSSLREVIDMVSTLQDLESKGNVIRSLPPLPTTTITTSSQSQTPIQRTISLTNQLESLRQEIIHKSEIQIERAKYEESVQEQINHLSIAILLPSVVDTLRTLSHSKSRTIFSFDEIVKILTTSLRLQDRKDIKENQMIGVQLIHRLAHEIPEFITIFPIDEVISYSTIRLNLSAPIVEIKTKLRGLSEVASLERDRIRNNIQLIGINQSTK